MHLCQPAKSKSKQKQTKTNTNTKTDLPAIIVAVADIRVLHTVSVHALEFVTLEAGKHFAVFVGGVIWATVSYAVIDPGQTNAFAAFGAGELLTIAGVLLAVLLVGAIGAVLDGAAQQGALIAAAIAKEMSGMVTDVGIARAVGQGAFIACIVAVVEAIAQVAQWHTLLGLQALEAFGAIAACLGDGRCRRHAHSARAIQGEGVGATANWSIGCVQADAWTQHMTAGILGGQRLAVVVIHFQTVGLVLLLDVYQSVPGIYFYK